jgi:murein endopeptidase/LysM repeat protein
MRASACVLSVVVSALFLAPARALPPPGAAVPGASAAGRWVQHRVIPGDRLAELAEHYGVLVSKILEWNTLDAAKPLLRTGQKLRIWTEAPPLERMRQRYVVRRGDSWSTIAKRFDVDRQRLRSVWNPSQTELKAGDAIVVWVDAPPPEPESPPPSTSPTPAATPAPPKAPAAPLPLVAVAKLGKSVGTPTRGRLVDGVQLPDNPSVYTLRNPEQSFGSSHAVEQLQRALATFRRDTGFDREIVVCDMSRRRGGRFRPHRSHTSGRDVDIRLPLRRGVAPGTIPVAASLVDWDAAWRLVKTLLATEQVRYVFLARSRQRPLYQAALRAGESEAGLADVIEVAARMRTALVRHSAGHIKHIHVRFRCAADEPQCVDP